MMQEQLTTHDGQQQVNPMLAFLQGLHPSVPTGLSQLQAHCSSVYPPHSTEPPLCIRTAKSFIGAGGSEPLDYIYIYKNEGDPSQGIPKHWHYVGFGLSDIHNYELMRTFDIMCRSMPMNTDFEPLPEIFGPRPGPNSEKINGFGFELTFRVKSDDWNQEPPQWPGRVMQKLAKYVYQSKIQIRVGDHVAWHCSLDDESSQIKHMVMTLDPQLGETDTALGKVRFIQLVGVCQEELQAAREWNVRGVLEIMKEREETGGPFLVTDMRRGESIQILNPEAPRIIEEGISRMGSEITSVSTKHKYSACKPKWYKWTEKMENLHNRGEALEDEEPTESQSLAPLLNEDDENSITRPAYGGVERGSFLTMNRDDAMQQEERIEIRSPSRMSYESESGLMVHNLEIAETRYYDSVYLLLNYESAKVLPVVLSGRLAHRRHFSFQSLEGDLLTTFIPEGCPVESMVSREQPFVRRGPMLQIYVCDRLREQMFETIGVDFNTSTDTGQMSLPRNYSWPNYKLHITIVDKIEDSNDG